MFKVDFVDGEAVSWKKENGVKAEKHPDYRPKFYIEGDVSKLQKSRCWLSSQEGVDSTCFEEWKPTLSKPEKKVLRVDTYSEGGLKSTVNMLKKKVGRSEFRYYNVGFSPQFMFCLQEEVCPVPGKKLDRMEIEMGRKEVADRELSRMKVDGEALGVNPVRKFRQEWREKDPDIVLVSSGQVLKLLEEAGVSLGRMNRFQKVAGENTVSSYGKTVHSPSRYNVPGRIVVDRSNSFLLKDATLEGMWDLVRRSYRPMQELAWGSIGRLLTSIEVKKAYLEKGILTPWKNWSGEEPKKASTLHRADRGGFIFNPEPGVHRDVYEADFASLFPNIMIEENISPETVCCDCCDNSRTPELDYSICEERIGFISETLEPLVEDRQRMKQEVEELEGEEKRKVQGQIDAIKWLLVSCFGYMGHAHASYGAIRCHQAIQAFDREIMVKTKEMFEERGYSVVHGIIDSIWVQKNGDAEKFEKVCEDISEEIGIELEPEHRFDWCAFVPRKSSEANISTLNRYFGKTRDGFKKAGIETEQRSTCEFVKDSQEEMVKALDTGVEEVVEVLEKRLKMLESGVDPEKLLKERKISKSLEDYTAENMSVAALKRASFNGVGLRPGQSVKFMVRDDDADPLERVRLGFEASGKYDTEYYRKELKRAAESVFSPFGVEREELEERLSRTVKTRLEEF